MNYFLILFFPLLFSCSSLVKKKESEVIRDLYSKKEYRPLLKQFNEKKLLSKPEDRFLRSVEMGSVYFRMGEYSKALGFFQDARDIADQLYTVRVSKKVESFILSDASDVYYPNTYEQSLVRFYEVMSHFMLASRGVDGTGEARRELDKKQVRFHRGAIESTLRNWQSYLENMSDQKLGEAVFKGSILSDAMSIIMHSYLGRRKDRSKVKSFKKIGLKTLKTRMGIYQSYNNKYKPYRDDYDKLHLKSSKALEKSYIDKTFSYKTAEKFFKEDHNAYVLVLRSFVGDKFGKQYHFPLNLLNVVLPFSDKNNFASFSRKVLYVSMHSDPTISFQLPQIKYSPTLDTQQYKVMGKQEVNGRSVLLANTSEVMARLIEDEAGSYKAKLGAKLAVKHLAILAAAFQTYKGLKKQGEFIAYAAGAASYAVANKALAHYQQADIRSWRGVHGYVELIPLKLKAGNYKLEYLGKKIDLQIPKKGKKIVPLIL